MKSTTILLALTSSTLATPFGSVIDAIFGTTLEARQAPPPDQMPGFQPIGTGSGIGFPFPTGTGMPFPFPMPTAAGTGTATSPIGTNRPGHHGHKGHRGHRGHKSKSKALAIDYQLAPTAAPYAKIGKVEKRQDPAATGSASLPSFTLLDPSDGVSAVPTATATATEVPEAPLPTSTDEPAFPMPTGTGSPDLPFPTGAPEAPLPTGGFPMPTGGFPGSGFPGTGIPSVPTTLQTMTRGPQPTGMPEFPTPGEGEGEGEGQDEGLQGWLDWLESLFGGKSEMDN